MIREKIFSERMERTPESRIFRSLMHIQVNGDHREIENGSTVSDLLGELQLRSDQVAVEINLKILDRKEFDGIVLQEDDHVEILSFIGGGSPSISDQPLSR